MHKKASVLGFFSSLVYVVTFTVLASGCKDVKKKTAFTIGFSQCIGSDLWRKTMLEEMNMELSLHPGANFVYADAGGNSKKQVSQLEDMLRQGIDLLIISPNEAQPLTEIVEETYKKGIPVIVIDRKTSSSLYTAYVGADNYELGKLAAEYVGTISKKSVNVLEIMGLPGSSPAIERDRGFTDGLKKFPDVHITTKIYGDWLKINAENQLIKIKGRLPDFDIIFAHNDVMASGAQSVLSRLNISKNVKIIGVDALPGNGGGLEMVNSKTIYASLLYPTGGKEAIVTAFRILDKEPFSRENILQSSVIDSTNVQLMKMQWSKINGQQSDIARQQALLEEQKQVYNSQQVVLNILVITLVLAVIFGGLAYYFLSENLKINKSLEVKNNEILTQRNQLVEMSARAQEATEAKLNFFTNVSHEFRTPLTLMLSPLEDMLNNERLVAIAGKNIKLINQNAFRLLKLVNQLIDYRKIQFDKQILKASENNIVEFVRDIVDSFRMHAQKLNINISLVSKEKDIKVWFDVNMLDKVFFNLISNAIKFCKEDGKIKITISKNDDNYVHIDVEDNGIGMSAEDTGLIFEQFYQAENAPVTGSGIGLSLSKEIVLFHHGHIEVKSQRGKGSTFSVSLPLGDEHLIPIEKSYYKNEWPDMVERSKKYKVDTEKIPENAIKESEVKEKEFSILIVEDNPDLLQYLTDKFMDDFEVFTANNGNAAIAKAFDKVPDLILSDVVLPGLSGKEISEKLKSDFRTSHIPIILLTAQGSIEHQISGMHALADQYITKPFNFDFLFASVHNLLKNRVMLKEHFTSDISPTEKLPVSQKLDKKFLNDLSAIVEQNLANEKFDVEDICQLMGISRVQLYRKAKALLGTSITDYVLNRRLKKAKYLLNNESYTISEIAYMVGFSNPNYFSTVFKAKYNCTPSEFKKNNSPIAD